MWHTTKFVSRKYVCMCICIYLGLYIYRSKRSTNYLTRSWLTVMRCLCSCSCYCTLNIYNNYRFIIFVYIRLEYLLYTICIVYIYIDMNAMVLRLGIFKKYGLLNIRFVICMYIVCIVLFVYI